MKRSAITAALATAEATVANLRSLLAQCDSEESDLLDVRQSMDRYGVGRDAILAAVDRGELAVSRGTRGKLLVRRSDLEAWLTSRPVAPRQRKVRAANDAGWDWDADAAEELRRAGGGR